MISYRNRATSLGFSLTMATLVPEPGAVRDAERVCGEPANHPSIAMAHRATSAIRRSVSSREPDLQCCVQIDTVAEQGDGCCREAVTQPGQQRRYFAPWARA